MFIYMRLMVAMLIFIFLPVLIFATGQQDTTPPFEDRFQDLQWEEIVAEASGGEVFWYMWGGSETINTYVQQYIAGRLMDEYDIRLTMVPVTDSSIFVNKVLDEKNARRLTNGSVDLVWINGENFRTMREGDLLFGPFANKLPNIRYIDADSPSLRYDFGYPIDGYESPYGSTQMVMIYDEARIPKPPTTINSLLRWIRQNPGRFIYPAAPDFTGSAFIRHFFYYFANELDLLLGEFNLDVYQPIAEKTWQTLNEIKPFLWREGTTYPETATQLEDLFSNGEIWFDMAYNPSEAASLVDQGRYPESTRTFVFDSGTIGNTHYVAIPFNSPNKAAAMVLANLLLDPAAQFEKSKPAVWGDHTALSLNLLPDEWQNRFEAEERAPSVLSPLELSQKRLPELQASWIQRIEDDWIDAILKR